MTALAHGNVRSINSVQLSKTAKIYNTQTLFGYFGMSVHSAYMGAIMYVHSVPQYK